MGVTGLRPWRTAPRAADGPYRATAADIPALNAAFSEAFTDRYRKDGLVGVRVPALNPLVWRYALADAGEGALLWRGDRGEVVAFNVAHRSGREGWMGPLAVLPAHQGKGLGKAVVTAGVEWLKRAGARAIGLETMPRTMDNIGFYSTLGFVPGRLTLTVTLDAPATARTPDLLGRLAPAAHEAAAAECAALLAGLGGGHEFSREVALTEELALGDTVLARDAAGALVGFAVCHSAPLVEGRVREEVRVLKLVVADPEAVPALTGAVRDFARRSGARRAAFRVQGEYPWLYRALLAQGGRVRWSDLRMTLDGYGEAGVGRGAVLSNWEI